MPSGLVFGFWRLWRAFSALCLVGYRPMFALSQELRGSFTRRWALGRERKRRLWIVLLLQPLLHARKVRSRMADGGGKAVAKGVQQCPFSLIETGLACYSSLCCLALCKSKNLLLCQYWELDYPFKDGTGTTCVLLAALFLPCRNCEIPHCNCPR